jgi:hypothetical protein
MSYVGSKIIVCILYVWRALTQDFLRNRILGLNKTTMFIVNRYSGLDINDIDPVYTDPPG